MVKRISNSGLAFPINILNICRRSALFLHSSTDHRPSHCNLSSYCISLIPAYSCGNHQIEHFTTIQFELVLFILTQNFFCSNRCHVTGVYWHQRADERHGKHPEGNQELLVVKDKVGRPPSEFGISKSMECDIFPFSALTLLVERQEGHPVCKKNWVLVCWR